MDRPVLVAELGSGGMADVFLAMRQGMGGFVKLFVIKRLRKNVDADVVEMFHDEARISARLNHPNVVQTHEVGFDDDGYRLEMEYLDGQPLHRIMHRAQRQSRAISISAAVFIARCVLAGLHYAHDLCDYDGSPLGIVHRDVSPQNVFITYDGNVKVVDFGIAKAAGQMSVTQLGIVKGKIRYMAPEQALGEHIDRRADVFAVGIILWQLLAADKYWGDADEMEIYRRLRTGELPPSPRSRNPEIPEELDKVVMRALARHAQDRFDTAEEFQRALEACVTVDAVGERAFSAMVAELFAEKRQAVKAAIEKAAARAAQGPTSDSAPVAVIPASSVISVVSEPASLSDRPVTSKTAMPKERSRSWLLLVAPALVVSAGMAVWAWRAPATPPTTSGTAVAADSAPPSKDVPPAVTVLSAPAHSVSAAPVPAPVPTPSAAVVSNPVRPSVPVNTPRPRPPPEPAHTAEPPRPPPPASAASTAVSPPPGGRPAGSGRLKIDDSPL